MALTWTLQVMDQTSYRTAPPHLTVKAGRKGGRTVPELRLLALTNRVVMRCPRFHYKQRSVRRLLPEPPHQEEITITPIRSTAS